MGKRIFVYRQTVYMLTNSPKISDITKRDILQLNFSDSDEKV